MNIRFRRAIQLSIVATSLLALGASDTKCEGEGGEGVIFRAIREIFTSIEALEEAVCVHYELSGDKPPEFCPDDTDPCSLPADPGPCEAAIPRWYFDQDSGQCERFIYGGCQGNENNFVSKAACEGVCIPCDLECAPHQVCRRNELCEDGPCDREFYCADTCRGVECEEGEHCELRDVLCVTAPCPPVAMCVPDRPDPCDGVVCEDDEVCYYPTPIDRVQVGVLSSADSSVIITSVQIPPLEIEPLVPEGGLCVPLDPCEETLCRVGEICQAVPRHCSEDAPSCPPVGRCVPEFTCEGFECPDGEFCVMHARVCKVGEVCTAPYPACVPE